MKYVVMKQVGQKIKELRLQKEWTQTELGAKLKVNQSYIARIEKGDHNVSVNLLEEISKALGVKLVVDFSP